METGPASSAKVRKLALIRLVGGVIAIAAMFFLPAGTFRYWQAWVYMLILLVPLFIFAAYLFLRNPALLERRMRTREMEPEQRKIIALSSTVLLAAFIVPGLDRRFGWSSVPTWLVLIADAMVLLSYLLFILVLRANEYAGRTVEVEQRQRVITTGPYSLVRHPMYLAVLLMYGCSPLALGSAWAMIVVAILPIVLLARIVNEEKVLLRDLEGYADYCKAVRYRLIPGI
ncbi:MAG: isoprenylcysteine carboxylmethyltransferase family protein, partial [Chloroflexi bacterium]|nr:isoprenylcysteine carboxylmethyltransferase family protein [Chloroflexota bacterium]